MNTRDFDWDNRLYALVGDSKRGAITIELAVYNIKDVISQALESQRQQLLKAVEEMRRNPQRDTDNLTPPILRIALEQLDEQDNAYNEALDQVIELLRQKII